MYGVHVSSDDSLLLPLSLHAQVPHGLPHSRGMNDALLLRERVNMGGWVCVCVCA